MTAGDTLYVCGIHDEGQDSRISVGASGITLDGHCPLPAGGIDQGIVLNTGTRLSIGGRAEEKVSEYIYP